MNNPDSIESAYRSLLAERDRIDKAIAALAPLRAASGGPNHSGRGRTATPKTARRYATVTDAIRSKVLQLSALPPSERPSAPKIAKAAGISISTVLRIRRRANAK